MIHHLKDILILGAWPGILFAELLYFTVQSYSHTVNSIKVHYRFIDFEMVVFGKSFIRNFHRLLTSFSPGNLSYQASLWGQLDPIPVFSTRLKGL